MARYNQTYMLCCFF